MRAFHAWAARTAIALETQASRRDLLATTSLKARAKHRWSKKKSGGRSRRERGSSSVRVCVRGGSQSRRRMAAQTDNTATPLPRPTPLTPRGPRIVARWLARSPPDRGGRSRRSVPLKGKANELRDRALRAVGGGASHRRRPAVLRRGVERDRDRTERRAMFATLKTRRRRGLPLKSRAAHDVAHRLSLSSSPPSPHPLDKYRRRTLRLCSRVFLGQLRAKQGHAFAKVNKGTICTSSTLRPTVSSEGGSTGERIRSGPARGALFEAACATAPHAASIDARHTPSSSQAAAATHRVGSARV